MGGPHRGRPQGQRGFHLPIDTQKELTTKLRQNIDAFQGVELTEQSKMTLAQWLDEWLEKHMTGTVRPGTLDRWRAALLEGGYSPRTVNVRISVANSLMAFLGRRDLQSVGALEVDDVQPELTRTEYLRLLTTARALDKERLYLLVKLFGCTGIPLQELPRVTVEALHEGRVIVHSNGVVQLLHLPDFLRKELLAYARREGTVSGPIFHTKGGKPLGRTAVTDSIKQLCRDARVPEEKANPRCLKRLWQSTQDGIRTQIDLLVEQACDRLMETEQFAVGWDADKGVSDV